MKKYKVSKDKLEQYKKQLIDQYEKCDFCRKEIADDEYTTFFGKKNRHGKKPEYPIHKLCLERKQNVKDKKAIIWRGGTPQ